ncbi:MAG: cysteine--tRNA ligase [Gemmatimonadetes bacterium]|nr:cysteine--tRNA ligase [Gemmatimonadota bacterium]
MPLRFHNTLTRRKDLFEPLEPGRVRLYTCGPTVHDRVHIGNFRTFLFEDVLRRYLRYSGYEVTQVMNITDVDDKIIRKARAAGVPIGAFTAEFTRLFFEDAAALGIEPAEHYPRATEYVPEMVRLAMRLRDRGVTYERDGSLYFRIASFPGYGKLSGIDLGGARDGARVDSDEYEKEDPKDFVIWKAHREGEAWWDGELGPGRPGWHLECSAMAMELLGESFDIHTGGVDNVFPHHENEIAQSESATGRPFARYWLHAQHLVVGDRKMAKSVGNVLALRDLLEQGADPLAVRYLLIAAHYRSPMQFTTDALAQASAAVGRLADLHGRLRAAAGAEEVERAGEADVAAEAGLSQRAEASFREALDDDLNTPRALAVVFGFLREVHSRLDAGVPTAAAATWLVRLREWDRVLGVLRCSPAEVPQGIAALLREREEARAQRDYARSDELRKTIQERGYAVEDTPEGPRVKNLGAT